jgi:hypothetical protein
MTVQELVDLALNRLKVIALGDEATSTEGAYCLAEFNSMMHAFELDGMALAHIDAALADTIDVPDNHLETLRLSLMERIAGTFGKEMTARDVVAAEQGRMALRAYHFSIAELGGDHPLSERMDD